MAAQPGKEKGSWLLLGRGAAGHFCSDPAIGCVSSVGFQQEQYLCPQSAAHVQQRMVYMMAGEGPEIRIHTF